MSAMRMNESITEIRSEVISFISVCSVARSSFPGSCPGAIFPRFFKALRGPSQQGVRAGRRQRGKDARGNQAEGEKGDMCAVQWVQGKFWCSFYESTVCGSNLFPKFC